MSDKKRNTIFVGIGIILIVISNIIGHFKPPFSISIAPFLLTFIIAGINFRLYKSNFLLTAIYGFGLLIFNDLFIRFFAGGTHDQQGKVWISLFFGITLILASMAMIVVSFIIVEKGKSITKKQAWINVATVLFLATTVFTVYYNLITDI